MKRNASNLSIESEQKCQRTEESIDKLPTEIWIKILNYLDVRNLERIANISHRLKDIINSTPKINDKFTFTFCNAKIESQSFRFNALDTSPINYRKFKFHNDLSSDEVKFKNTLENYHEMIEELELDVISNAIMGRTMGCLKNLKTLKINEIHNHKGEKYDSISLPNLKSVSFLTIGFHVIKDHQLEEVSIHFIEPNANEINNFLMTCHNLKKFTISGNIQKLNFKEFPFNLKSLSLSLYIRYYDNAELVREMTCEFLKMHRETLRELTLEDYDIRDKENLIGKALAYAVNEMNLKELNVSKLGADNSIGELKTNRSIKKLRVFSFLKRLPNDQKSFFAALQGVETLIIDDYDAFISLTHISMHMKKLKRVILYTYPVQNYSRNFIFESIEVLEIVNQKVDRFFEFAARCPNLKVIKIRTTAHCNISLDLYNMLGKLKQLELMTIRYSKTLVKLTRKNENFVTEVFGEEVFM